MTQSRGTPISPLEFATAVSKATHKLGLSIDDLFKLCGYKGGRTSYDKILKSGRIEKTKLKKMNKYIDTAIFIVLE